MNNLNSISEYQKIVFVKGLNELSDELSNGKIQELSRDYPFVVFITNDNVNDNPIKNLWIEGTRLTRFRGIDPAKSIINVGNYTFKLNFDYETGLLSLDNALALSEIRIYKYKFISLNSNNQEYKDPDPNDPIEINSKDNTFSIIYKFIGGEDISYEEMNSISKSLIYNDNEYIIQTGQYNILDPESLQEIQEDNVQYVEYTYVIKQTKLGDNYYVNYYSPSYDGVEYDNMHLRLFLNPTDYDILINNVNVTNEEYVHLISNTEYEVTLIFKPTNINSYSSEHKIYVNLTSNNNISVIGSNDIEIYDSTCKFRILTPNVTHNTSIEANLTVDVLYQINSVEIQHYTLKNNQNHRLLITGEQSDSYFYFGYNTIMSIDDFEPNLEYKENIGESILYDGFEDATEVNANEYFYCVIPKEYRNIVKALWGAYTIDLSTNQKKYLDCLKYWFVEVGLKTINNIEFIIYRREKEGKFYGKIK